MNLLIAEIEAEIACRAGVVLASDCSVFSSRKLWWPSLILMAAEGWREKKKFAPRGRSKVKNKERVGGDGNPIVPQQGR